MQENNKPTNPYQSYFNHKQLAMLLEKTNLTRIIAFPSVTKKQPQASQHHKENQQEQQPEWYKLGGNSAYFYKYFIAPRLHKKPVTIRPDTDLNHRFKYGIVSIHWIDNFIKRMSSLGYTFKEESGLYIFDLNHTFTYREVEALKKQEQKDIQQANALLRPKHPEPSLYGIILELDKIIPAKAKKLKKGFHHDFAPELNHHLIAINKYYHGYANGNIDKPTAKSHLKTALDDLGSTLVILAENNCLDITSRLRIGRLLNDLNNSIERSLHGE